MHNWLPVSESFSEGRRNCATFLYGSVLYCILYVVVMNLRLRHGECMDSVRTGLLLAWLSDCAAVGVLYKMHYGRSLLNEVGEVVGCDDGNSRRRWVVDGETGKYRRPTAEEDVRREAEESDRAEAERRRIEAKREARERRARSADIHENKRRVRAAKVIQRWWRKKLYEPPDGILYLRAQHDWNDLI